MPIFEKLKEKLTSYYALLPSIYFFSPTAFKNRYALEEIQKNSDILKLFEIAKVSKEELIVALSPSADTSKKAITRKNIEIKIAQLSKRFSSFYQKENISIVLLLENNYLDLLVDNANLPVAISERSNGLRWYLDLFVHLESQNLLGKEVLLLIDEPGVYLHIDAQKKLLELFEDLSKKNQLIYTTHSPFMIDTDELGRIKLVESVDGYTHILNKCHASELTETSKMETLSPIIKALGFSLKYNLGPKFDKLNLIVEGISDYYYLQGALTLCGIKDEKIPFIMPSIGVNNIHNIASILIGWGVDFKIITDYDIQAYKEILDLSKLSLQENKDYFNLPLKQVDKNEMKDTPFTIEDMFEENDKKLFDKGDKHLSSKCFFELVKDGKLSISDTTISKFKKLFDAIL